MTEGLRFVYILALLLASAVADQAHANFLSLDTFAKLAAACAPSVAPETLAAVARTESGFDDGAVAYDSGRCPLRTSAGRAASSPNRSRAIDQPISSS